MKGFRKTSLELRVRTNTGKVSVPVSGFVRSPEPDKRKRKNLKYVRLFSIDPHSILGATQHVIKGNVSLVVKPSIYPVYDTLVEEKAAKIIAALRVAGYPLVLSSVSLSSFPEYPDRKRSNLLEGLIQYYEESFKAKRKEGRRKLKIFLAHFHKRKKRKRY
jgi:hypothetical protein